jgi:sugar O-acyltransferase (sialic acid O-acetyltransferase NeuD family)
LKPTYTPTVAPHPTVGTVVPSHTARYLRYALVSLLDQTMPHEIVVVDDASPNGEVGRVAKEFGLRWIRNPNREGPAVARNLGIEALDHPWILNFDMDNIAERNLVEGLLRAALREKRTGVAYSRALQFGEGTGPYWPVHRGLPWHLKFENFIDASSLFSRRAWEEAGGWDPKASPLSDWDLWIGIVERGWGLAFVPEYLFRYRVRSDGGRLSSSQERLERAEEYIRAKHAEFFRSRHARRPSNLIPRAWNRIRTVVDGWPDPIDPGEPMKLVIVGARSDGQAHIVLDMLEEGVPYEAVAFLDETPELWGSTVHGLPVLGPPDRVVGAMRMGARGAVVAIGDPHARERLAQVAREAGLDLPPLIHPRCYLAPSVEVGQGAYVAVLAVVYTGARVGDLAWVPPHAHVGHHVQVGDCATLSPGVRIAGRARIGRRAFLGVGAMVLPDVTVGDDAIVGAGAVVTGDVAPGTTVAGVPARTLRR